MFELLYFSFFVMFIGLCIGSFLNVVILRSLSGESIVFPPSKCPKCGNELKWFENIPLLSYLILRGKCRTCEEKISIQYPIIEFVTSFLFLMAFYTFGFSIITIFAWALSALGVVMVTTDLKEKVVFNVHTISFIVISLIFALFVGNIKMAIIGSIFGAFVIEGLSKLGMILTKKRSFGEGDTYIAAGIGALVGPKYFLLVFALSIFFQVVAIFPSFIKKLWQNNQQKIAVMLISFVFITLIYKFAQISMVLPLLVQLPVLLMIIGLGLYLCKKMIKLNKEDVQVSYIPFGPSLLIVALFVVYWGVPIAKFVKRFVS